MPALMDGLRLSLRLPVFVLFLILCVTTILLLRIADLVLPAPIDRAPLGRLYLTGLCHLLGFRIIRSGAPISGAALLVSNHVSWTDIAVLGASVPLRFLSKSEVADWPVIGWIARDIGTLFIERTAGRTAQVRGQIAATLDQGHCVLVFPEGTTSDGRGVLPFRGRLLPAATESSKPVQAITLAYRRKGEVDAIVPFVGSDSFQNHLVRLLSKPAIEVTLVFHPPLWPADQHSGQQMAAHLHNQVAQSLAELHDKKPVETDATASTPVRL